MGIVGLVEDLIAGAIGGDALNDGQSYREGRDIRHNLAVSDTDAEAIGARGEWRADRQDAGVDIDSHAGWSTRKGVGIGIAVFIATPCHDIANAARLER